MRTVWVVFIVNGEKGNRTYEAINSFNNREDAIKYSDYICKQRDYPKTMVASCKIHEWDEHLEEVENAEM